MIRSKNNIRKWTIAAGARRSLTAAAATVALGGVLGVPALAQNYNSMPLPGNAAPYSWPAFHSGAVTASPAGPAGAVVSQPTPAGVPDPSAAGAAETVLPGYYQLDGTPSGVEQQTVTVGNPPISTVTFPYTQIFSQTLGNYVATAPPGGLIDTGGSYSVADIINDFGYVNDTFPAGNYRTISGPLAWDTQNQIGNDVEGSPVAINATDFPEIASMNYNGQDVSTAVGGVSTGAPGAEHGIPPGQAAPNNADLAIRQVVYYTREETDIAVKDPVTGLITLGGVPISYFVNSTAKETASITEGTAVQVGTIYAMDGFTGDIIWRYEVPSFDYTSTVTGATTTGIAAMVNASPVESASGAGPQPFEVGMAPTGDNITGITEGPAGTITLTYPTATPYDGLNSATLDYSLQAISAVNNGDGTASYSGNFQMYATTADANSPLVSGTFTATATFTTPYAANVAGYFTVTGGSDATNIGPLRFTGTFGSSGAGVAQTLTGTLATEGSGAILRTGGNLLNSVTVARVPVMTPATTVGGAASTTAQTRLVVIAADNNGYVYCLDALGNDYWNGDTGTSNTNALYVPGAATSPNGDGGDALIDGLPNYDVLTGSHDVWSGTAYAINSNPHIGTTFPYWIYRPDPNQPLTAAGAADTASADHTLPVPQAFDHSSPEVYVSGTTGTVYLGNSNGVLYALDTGGGLNTTTGATTNPANTFNVMLTGEPGIFDDTPTTKVDWWDALSGPDADTSASTVSIQSTPALYSPPTGSAPLTGPNGPINDPVVYVTTCTPDLSAVGRVYAVDALTGPTTSTGAAETPGSADYNVNPTGIWQFPKTTSLGDIQGSPAVFTNPDDGTTRLYFGANCGEETQTTSTTPVPATDTAGRIWSIDAGTGDFDWVYPSTASGTGGDPDVAGTIYDAPLSGFEYATPAMGLVQWPSTIQYLVTDDTTGTQTPTFYTHTDSPNNAARTFTEDGTKAGPTVPMLYIGTSGGADSYLYYIDIDGHTDTERDIYALQTPATESGYQSSPVLVVNPSSGNPAATPPVLPGNGGVLFFTLGPDNPGTDTTGQGASLYEYQATPTSTSSEANTAVPQQDFQFPFGGPISSPAVAGATTSDLVNATTSSNTVTEWVYIGDTNTGLCYGFAPNGNSEYPINSYLTGIVPPATAAQQAVPTISPFPLRAYISDGSTAHPATSTAMTTTDPYGMASSPLPVFEWGQNASIRIANVVPPGQPNAAVPDSYVTTQYTYTDTSGNTHPYYLANGSAINIYTAQVDNSGNVTSTSVAPITIPALMLPLGTTPNVENGFFERTDQGTPATGWGMSSELLPTTEIPPTGQPFSGNPYRAPETVLLDGNLTPNNGVSVGLGIAASATYSVGFTSLQDPNGANTARRNTPGSRRELSNVKQTATLYQGVYDPTTGALTGFTAKAGTSAITLSLTATPNFSYPIITGTGSTATTSTGQLYIDQPTFGILNPIAVRGGGVNLTPNTPVNPNGTPTRDAAWTDGATEGAGPFEGVSTLPSATAGSSATLTPVDLEALANGNICDLSAPPSGQLAINLIGQTGTGTGTTNGAAQLQAIATDLKPYYRYVITTTGQIPDGTAGDNSDPVTLPSEALPTQAAGNLPYYGDASSGVGGLPKGSEYGQYLLNVADRSMLGLDVALGLTTQTTPSQLYIDIPQHSLNWQDNTGLGGPGSRINPLSWDDIPTVGGNSSRDYPNIPAADLSYSLSEGSLPGAVVNTTSASPQSRYIQPQSVQTLVDVPKYQPANLQMWQGAPGAFGKMAPDNPLTGQTTYNHNDENFPMGYSTRVRVFGAASVNNSTPRINTRDRTQPYRDFYVYSGVPVDIKTSIASPTTDIGVVPQGFGVQLNALKATANANGTLSYDPNGTTAIGPFTPYNGYDGYLGHFQPLDIISNSNVNLINPHLDQKVTTVPLGQNNSTPPDLTLLSDGLDSGFDDPYSYIPAFDWLEQTGPRTLTFNGIAEQPFLVRSSLDTDLSEAYGKSPLLSTAADQVYPVVTLHKPRVGDSTGSTMSVPDVPHDSGIVPTSTSPEAPGTLNTASRPMVSVAVPLGTPVGTYAQNLRLFEGYDTANYNPLVGPLYNTDKGDVGGGFGTFDPSALLANGANQDSFQLGYSDSVPVGLQPYSDPATQIKVEVEESRLTNGFTPGALPMGDITLSGPSVTNPTANQPQTLPSVNYAPFAFRDPSTGDLSLYWTTLRTYVPGQASTDKYNIIGANLGFIGNFTDPTQNQGYFTPASSGQSWWSAITAGSSPPLGNNVDWVVALDQALYGTGYGPNPQATVAYGFDINIAPNAPHGSTINCYAVDPKTGELGGTAIPVASSVQAKSDVHAVKVPTGTDFVDPNGGSDIPNDLWTFWAGGTRGHTSLYYSSALASDLGDKSPFTLPSTLPVPAGLVDIGDPNPVLINAPSPDPSKDAAAIPSLEVTYSGVGSDGNSDIYVSRYQPYHPLGANGVVSTGSPLLGLMAYPQIIEQLNPVTRGLSQAANGNSRVSWWSARDVGWLRNNQLQVEVNISVPSSPTNPPNYTTYTALLTMASPSGAAYNPSTYYCTSWSYNAPFTYQATPPSGATSTSGKVVYDRASGILVLTDATLPVANGNAVKLETGQTVYIDLAGGRVRVSGAMPNGAPYVNQAYEAYSTIAAQFSPTARRITTSAASDTAPVSFLDEAYQSNSSGVASDQNVQADRYWFLWRKAAVGTTPPTIWYKSQRLTVPVLNQVTGLPVAIDPNQLTVTLKSSGAVLYKSGGTDNVVDVDGARGRLYFPITYSSGNGAGGNSSTALEGQQVVLSGTDSTGTALSTTPITIEWLDEPLYNDTSNNATSIAGVQEAAASDGYQVPMQATVNESGISAFVDPQAYENTITNTPIKFNPGAESSAGNPGSVISSNNIPLLPHNLWLFWTSTRNGSSDLYYETINPRFAAVTNTGSP